MAVLLAMISGAAHAAWNALVKHAGKRHGQSERTATLVVLTIGLIVGVLALPSVAWPMRAVAMPRAALPWVLMAGLGETAYVVSLGIAYARGDLSLTYAISRSTALVVIWPISALLFATVPSALALVGTVLVLVGVVLCRPAAKANTEGARWSVPWTIATGCAVGLYHAGYKGAVEAGASPIPAFVLALLVAVPLLWSVRALWPTDGASPAAMFRIPALWVAGVLSAVSFILLIVALTTADSGRMLGVRNASVGFAVILALFMGERPSVMQWVGLSLLGAGVAIFGWEQVAS